MKNKTPIERVHKRKNIIFKIIILILFLSIFIFFTLNSSLFDIKEIRISNNENLQKEDILKESKVNKGTNIFKIKSKDIEEKLLENPSIKSASINRTLPSTINIEIKERQKTFSFQYISMYLLVDEEGYIMDHLDKKDSKLPNVKGFNTNSTKVGQTIFAKEENEKLNIFINEANKLKLLSQIDEIDKNFANDVNIKLKNEISVAFGPLSNVKYKLSLLKEILEDINKKEIKTGKIIMDKGDHPILIIDK
ncbi:MAG: cell division protein FtsQ/DivIB [Tissierella sp.]|uniref:cell division protein FtsQ/DivIB n=1 Tax=Tissierella sp. TaxID=41274 RepID=UPI003F96CD59